MDHKTLTVNGLRLHYTVAGAGPDIVFVHGWASSRRMWTTFLPHLTRSFRCWALDLPGFGDSEKPASSWYSIPNFTAALLAFMQQHDLERPSLVGHSMGALLALAYAARHPEQVERLVLLSIPYFGAPDEAMRFFRTGPVVRLQTNQAEGPVCPVVFGVHRDRHAEEAFGSGLRVVGIEATEPERVAEDPSKHSQKLAFLPSTLFRPDQEPLRDADEIRIVGRPGNERQRLLERGLLAKEHTQKQFEDIGRTSRRKRLLAACLLLCLKMVVIPLHGRE